MPDTSARPADSRDLAARDLAAPDPATRGLTAPAPLAPLAGELREGSRDLEAYVDESLARVDAMEPQLRALVPEPGRAERVRAEARALAAKYPDPAVRPPLFGVLAGIKDIVAVDGLPTRAGSALPAEVFAMPEAAIVRRLREVGAIILGKTVTAEFASMSANGTANPHDTTHSPGGSSSGSAAGVAAGYMSVAVGTQTGGSVIRPASYCGIVGLKPTYDRIPTEGIVYHARSVDTLGLYTQDVEGIELAAAATVTDWRPAPPREARDVVLGVPDGAWLDMTDPDAREVFESTVARLAATVTVRRVPFLEDAEAVIERHAQLMNREFADAHAELFPHWGALYSGSAAETIDRGRRVSDARLQAGLDGRFELRERTARLLADHGLDALVCPAAPGAAPDTLKYTGDSKMNAPWTHAGVPAITLPGATVGHMPFGVQLVGAFGADEALVATARAVAPLI